MLTFQYGTAGYVFFWAFFSGGPESPPSSFCGLEALVLFYFFGMNPQRNGWRRCAKLIAEGIFVSEVESHSRESLKSCSEKRGYIRTVVTSPLPCSSLLIRVRMMLQLNHAGRCRVPVIECFRNTQRRATMLGASPPPMFLAPAFDSL